jgi:hypothetical protein
VYSSAYSIYIFSQVIYMKKIQLCCSLVLIIFFSSALHAGDVITKNVEAIYKESATLAGKQIQVTGKVVKVNNGIMKRNFLHIQDGTGGQGTNDLTVTSQQTAKVGDEVVVTGTVVLNTDFGFGYAYPLLLEKSTISKK